MNGRSAKRKLNILSRILLICMLVGILSVSFTHAKAARTVKVAFFPMEGFHVLEADGSIGGMDSEYMEALCQYTGWNIEYVICGSWDDALAKLEAHAVDLVGSAQYSPERAATFDYADLSSGYTFGMIATTSESELAYEDFSAMANITFGMVNGYVREAEFYQYLADNGINDPTVIKYNSTYALQRALSSGEIDAIAHTFMEIKAGQRLIGRFAPKPIYYITWRGNTELLRELNDGISDLMINQPELATELTNKYYESKLDKTVLLTTEEKDYVSSKQVLNIGFLSGHYPFSYIHQETGLFAGLTRELLEEGLAWTGLQLNFIEFETHEDAHDALASGEIDLQSYCIQPEYGNYDHDFKILPAYAELPLVLVSSGKKSFSDINTLATIPGFSKQAEQVIRQESTLLVTANTQRYCFNMLLNGMADAALCDGYLAENLLRTEPRYQELQIVNVLNVNHTVHMVVHSSAEPALESILLKSIGSVNERDINEHTLAENTYPIMDLNAFIRKHSAIIVTALLLILIVIVIVTLRFVRNSRKIQQLMYKDPAMDVWNMNYLYYMGRQKILMDRKSNFAVVCLNISKLRRYNVVYGWNAGQLLLDITKDTLKSCTDETRELCARNYADRFVVLLAWNDWDAFLERLQKMQQLIETLIFNKTESRMRIQMGVCPISAKGYNLPNAVACANQALEAIANDNSTTSEISVYDTSFEKTLKERHELEKLLEAVSIEDNFVTYYQSKVDIRTNSIVGAEALVRFCDPTANGAIKSPAYFVPYYEQTGRITEVDFFVLESACKLLRKRLDEGKPIVPISCNFSRMHFVKPGFVQRFESVLDKYQISKDLIEVEVTETLIVDDLQQYNVRTFLNELKTNGIRLSIDDFGSGYSSLGTFELVPASVVKLDRSFLLNYEDRERQVKIMRNIVKMSEDLNFQIVCEGVETQVDVDLMNEVHAYVAQGYYYSKPIPETDFELKLDT